MVEINTSKYQKKLFKFFKTKLKMMTLFLIVASLVAVNCAPFGTKNPMINEGEHFFGGDMLGVKSEVIKLFLKNSKTELNLTI